MDVAEVLGNNAAQALGFQMFAPVDANISTGGSPLGIGHVIILFIYFGWARILVCLQFLEIDCYKCYGSPEIADSFGYFHIFVCSTFHCFCLNHCSSSFILFNLLTLIPSLSVSTASSLNLPSGPAIVSILVSKNAGRYRIQGDSYPAMLLGQ